MKHGSRPNTNRGACGGTSRLPIGKQWRPHCGARQRGRALRRSWTAIEALCAKDPEAKAARERLLDAVSEDPDAEFAALHLGHTALLAAADCRTSWAASVNHLLDTIEAGRAAAAPAADLGVGPDGMPPDLRAALASGAGA
jgi:hypothetical protein